MRAGRRITLEPAWVLHARPWRDTSLLLEAFTRDHGRVGMVARGVRGPRGRFRGLLQPLQPLLLSWAGRGELKTLSGCEAAAPVVTLRGESMLSAWYVNELLLRVLQRDDPHPALFAAYAQVMQGLAHGAPAALRLFEKRLLDELGWGADYDRVADDGSAVVAEGEYGFTPERGVVMQGGALRVRGASLLALAREELDDAGELREAKRVLRAAVDAHLGDHPLRSRELLRQWRRRTV